MKRLTLRLPDITVAALRRELASEREFRGRRYSMNDLCVRKLGSNGASARHQADSVTASMLDSTTMTPRVPPPPPVPMRAPTPVPMSPVQEPQPERSVRMAKEFMAEALENPPHTAEEFAARIVAKVDSKPNPNEQAELDALAGAADAEAEAEARGQWEAEGGPDGHLDH